MLELSISVMQETPTFAVALASALLLFQWCKRPHWSRLLASGIVMGIGLEIKLTAVLVVPAMLVEIALTRRVSHKSWQKITLLNTLQWTLAAGLAFIVIALIWGGGSFESSYKSHFVEHSDYRMARPEDFPPPASLILDHAECMIAAAAGLVIAARRRLREFAFPVVLLATALAVHAVHRPWWDYYYLHPAIPLCWLAAFAVNEAISVASQFLSKRHFDLGSLNTWKGLAVCLLIALALTQSERRLEGAVKNLRQRPRLDASPVLAKMKEYANRTHQVYVHYGREIYPFHAQMMMPPEIAVVTMKRFWSDQISTRDIVDICERSHVDQLLLNPARIDAEWKDLLSNYEIAFQDTNSVLYLGKWCNRR